MGESTLDLTGKRERILGARVEHEQLFRGVSTWPGQEERDISEIMCLPIAGLG